ncbi:hypothetical protein J6O86_09650 [bacterium]|nr:hypothetical protein [bacterium]
MKTILIDLDGVLNTYTGNYQADYISPIKEGAYDLLKKLSYEYDVKIFTTRNQDLTKEWLINNDIYKYTSEITNKKIPAWLIIDDRCITFSGDYEDLMNKIEKFR